MESYPVRNLTQSEYFGGRKLARAWRKKQKLRTYAKKKKKKQCKYESVLHKPLLRLHIRKNFFIMRVVKH